MKTQLLILCLTLILISCEKEELILQDTAKPGISLKKKGASAASGDGALVVRGEEFFGVLFYDSTANLTTLWGIDVATVCEGEFNLDVVPLQDVITKDGRIHRLQKGPVHILVFEGVYEEGGANICEFLAEAPLVAEGEGRVVYTDNDVFPAGRPNQNAFSYKAHGILYGPDGQKYMFNGHLSVVWDGVNVETFSEGDHYQIILRPLPG